MGPDRSSDSSHLPNCWLGRSHSTGGRRAPSQPRGSQHGFRRVRRVSRGAGFFQVSAVKWSNPRELRPLLRARRLRSLIGSNGGAYRGSIVWRQKALPVRHSTPAAWPTRNRLACHRRRPADPRPERHEVRSRFNERARPVGTVTRLGFTAAESSCPPANSSIPSSIQLSGISVVAN